MTAQDTLLAHIVPLYGKTEVVATEALRYILQQSEAARAALESMLSTAGVEVDSLTRFQTEAPGDKGERVDLVCYDASDAERVLIEAKFWAGLTDNQPNTYLDRLPKNGQSVLLFVVPTRRMNSLWIDLCTRAQEKHQLNKLPEAGELRSATIVNSERNLMLTSWRFVLEQMETQANKSGDVRAAEDIRQLRGLTEREAEGLDLCLCDCGHTTKPKSNFIIGHDAKAKSYLERAFRSLEPDCPNADPLRLPHALVEWAKDNPSSEVVGYKAVKIPKLAERVGVRETR